MKTLQEYIKESLIIESLDNLKGCIYTTWKLVDYLNEEHGVELDDVADISEEDEKEFLKRINAFKKLIRKANLVNLGNWWGDNDEEWEYFYEKTGISNNDKVIVLFQDGDDGTFAYIVLNNRIKTVRGPIYKKFIEMLGVDYITNF